MIYSFAFSYSARACWSALIYSLCKDLIFHSQRCLSKGLMIVFGLILFTPQEPKEVLKCIYGYCRSASLIFSQLYFRQVIVFQLKNTRMIIILFFLEGSPIDFVNNRLVWACDTFHTITSSNKTKTKKTE